MKYAVIPPCDDLKDFISHFWVGTWDVNFQGSNSTHYIIAGSLTEITFAFKNNKKHSELLFSSVQGQTYKPNQYAVDEFYHLLGVSLYSFAIPSLFNLPSSELNNKYLSLGTFLGQDGNILNEKIALANTTQERINILTAYFRFLLSQQRLEDKQITKAIKRIIKSNGNSKILELSRESCLSQKQFERRFREFSGFTPKIYSRIIRFESFIKNYSRYTNLTEAAHANGYYDQAHFIHEFKTFTGFSPKNFWKLDKENS